MANNSNSSGWGDLIPVPKESYEDWISIENLLLRHTIPVIAEAVDKSNVQCLDATGRRILATNGGENDIYSKEFAKKHLAIRNSIDNCSAEQSDFFDERLEIESSPLEKFGWPKDNLPDFKSLNPHVTSIQPTKQITSKANVNSWIDSAREIGKSYIEEHQKKNLFPTQDDVSDHIAKQLRKQSIHGPNGPVSSSYVKRQAIQGDWWKKNKPSR